MGYHLQCDLEKQDCATLYPSNTGRSVYKLPFTSQSCVRDNRLEGNIGRCGFPGAPCILNSENWDNCAAGGRGDFDSSGPLCKNGACEGKPGASCVYNGDCNWGINCNHTYSTTNPGVCGGFGAYMNNSEVYAGLDFGRDYCLSGKAYQNSIGYWLCEGGPPMALTSPPIKIKPKVSTGLIAGVSAGGGTLLAAIIIFIIWRQRRQNRSKKNPAAVSTSDAESSKGDEEKVKDTYVPRSGVIPPANKPSFSNPMMAPSGAMFLPEIQSEGLGRGNIPIRQTSNTLASWENRMPVAATVSDEHSLKSDEGKLNSNSVPRSEVTPSPRPHTDSSSLDPPTDKPSSSNPMIVPSRSVYLPEIQSEGGQGRVDIPFRQTTNSPPIAHQDRNAASSTNPGLHPTAISTTMNAKSSSNQLSDTAMLPSNQGSEELKDTYVRESESILLSQPYTDSSSLAHSLRAPPSANFLPEIQSDNGPRRANPPTTASARAPMARQDANFNTNSGFYPAAISATMRNPKSSPNLLNNNAASNTNPGFYHTGFSANPTTEFSANQLYNRS